MIVNGGDTENIGKLLIIIMMKVHGGGGGGGGGGINKGRSEGGQWLWQQRWW